MTLSFEQWWIDAEVETLDWDYGLDIDSLVLVSRVVLVLKNVVARKNLTEALTARAEPQEIPF